MGRAFSRGESRRVHVVDTLEWNQVIESEQAGLCAFACGNDDLFIGYCFVGLFGVFGRLRRRSHHPVFKGLEGGYSEQGKSFVEY